MLSRSGRAGDNAPDQAAIQLTSYSPDVRGIKQTIDTSFVSAP